MEGKVLEAIEILRSTRVEEPADIMPEMPATPQAAPSPAALNLQKKVRRQRLVSAGRALMRVCLFLFVCVCVVLSCAAAERRRRQGQQQGSHRGGVDVSSWRDYRHTLLRRYEWKLSLAQ